MIERPVTHSIDPLSLKELSLYVEKAFIEVFPSTNFVYQPEVFLIFHRIMKLSNVFRSFLA
jgi:hypothetical protein